MRTLVGRRPGGFFIPYRHAGAVAPLPYPALEPMLMASLPAMCGWLARIEALDHDLAALVGPPPRPRWAQDWFPRLDGAALYTIVRTVRPQQVLEIGSGHSTRFLCQAIADAGIACTVTCIDPQPRADLAMLPVRLLRRLLTPQDADHAGKLGRGDLLVIDSSHVAMPGSDVDLLLNHVLPQVAPGVLVHWHDIFLPDPYPASWAWRGYNEQVAIAGLLQGGGYAVRFASHYLVTRHPALGESGVLERLHHGPDAPESSLWLEKLPAIPPGAQSA